MLQVRNSIILVAKQISIPGGGRIILRSLSQGGDRDPVSDGGLWGSGNLSELGSPLSLLASYMTVDPGPLDPNWRNEIAIYSGFQIIHYVSFFIKPENNKIYHAMPTLSRHERCTAPQESPAVCCWWLTRSI